MTKPAKYVPKHRSEPTRAPQRAIRTTVVLTGVAAAATGVTVSGGVVAAPVTAAGDSSDVAVHTGGDTASLLQEREQRAVVSRSDRRGDTDPAKAAALSSAGGPAVARSEDLSDADPREIAKALLPEFGYDASQFSCLDSLYISESNWRVTADNPTSSAYGIPQALTQLHDLPPDYMTSAEAQIRWGLGYIRDTYGTPCNAWSFKSGNGWY